ncbi:MAG: hypothetical protein A2287_09200 [Candidatus Melainabacteria bacterium RIFOXYA12_FULL_32_12]|nr:MAG: hypothetical protein A2104_09590 [Candidatus Melainabacteria bacterium GWF2_32_7]OGI17999.1 MAG: hypothetical protein A2255_03730 [Candidatus Melainabacteria bacterium RIFOXYA2_FULL_32_9]OGI24248.1 MAG: hypothetical protein A2287_09200 [Candidatus Melainabacteria bacterium RIFOXYA12_FULL_32_12]
MLRRHKVTLEFDADQNVHILNIDGYTIHLTHDDMSKLHHFVDEKGTRAAEDIANYLREQDPTLYETKLIPMSENQNAYDVYEVLNCQFSKPVFTQRPER